MFCHPQRDNYGDADDEYDEEDYGADLVDEIVDEEEDESDFVELEDFDDEDAIQVL